MSPRPKSTLTLPPPCVAIGNAASMRCSAAFASLAIAAFMMIGPPTSAGAGPITLPVSVSGPTTIVEGTTTVEYTFTVTNDTSHDLTIDYAVGTVLPVSGDPTDFIRLSRGGGLGMHSNSVAAGGVGHYPYFVSAPGVPDGTSDFGVSAINFGVELSDIPAFGPPELEENAAGTESLLVGDEKSGIFNPFVSFGDCLSAPAKCPIGEYAYPPALNPGFDIYLASASISVVISDVPEPSSLALIATSVLASIGVYWHNNRRRMRKL